MIGRTRRYGSRLILTWISVSKKFIEDELESAMNNQREIVNFKTKNLNIWTDASLVWIPDKKWIQCDFGFDRKKFKGRVCWGGLDLAAHVDLNALGFVFENEEEEDMLDVLMEFWIPEEKIQEKKDQVGPAPEWRRAMSQLNR